MPLDKIVSYFSSSEDEKAASWSPNIVFNCLRGKIHKSAKHYLHRLERPQKPTNQSNEDIRSSANCSQTQWTLRTIKPLKSFAEGSYGRVGIAKHRISREIAALKIINKAQENSDEIKLQNQLIENELKVWNRLNGHNFIIELKGHFEGKNKYYFVSELAKRGSLLDLLCKRNVLEEHEIRIITAQLASAIHFMHSKKIMHRDLKPANILIGNDGKIKVADFGLSIVGRKSSVLVGTPEYTAPEVYGGGNYGPTCDWYSLGIMVYEMFNGYPPYAELLGIIPENYCQMNAYERAEWIRKILLEMDVDVSCKVKNEDGALLVKNLTVKKIKKRIGYDHRRVLKKLRGQPFFSSYTWDSLLESSIV